MYSCLVVVADFDIIGVTVHETKADAPLIVDCNRALTLSIVFQCVQAISRWNSEIFKLRNQIHILRFSDGTTCNVRREALRLAIEEKIA